MLITQACCVALGLHLHDSYVRASIEQGQVSVTEGKDSAMQSLGDVQPMFRLLTVGWIMLLQVFVAFLTLSRVYRELNEETEAMRVKALTRERQVRKTRDALIFGLAALAESRDPETGRHLERIALYSARLANELYQRGLYPRMINREFLRTIGPSSTLHDIGKVSVRDDVLRKPGALTDEERKHIQTHTSVGGECIHSVELQTGDSHFLEMARQIALHHHERWDGSGYPHRLAGDDIPLCARIVAIADVYDALSVRRTYKPALPHKQCVELIATGAGTQFDPTLVEAFLHIECEFAEIARLHSPGELASEDHHALDALTSLESLNEISEVESELDVEGEVISLSLLLSNLQSQATADTVIIQNAADTSSAVSPASPSA